MELTRKRLLAGGALAGAATLAGTVPSAAAAVPDDDDPLLVGSWSCTTTATNPPLGQMTGLQSYHRGGVLTESRRLYVPETPLGPLLETGGHGAWKRAPGPRAFTAFFSFLLQQAPPSAGAALGTDNIALAFTVARSGASLAGTFESNLKDTAGGVVFTVRGTVAGERIAA